MKGSIFSQIGLFFSLPSTKYDINYSLVDSPEGKGWTRKVLLFYMLATMPTSITITPKHCVLVNSFTQTITGAAFKKVCRQNVIAASQRTATTGPIYNHEKLFVSI